MRKLTPVRVSYRDDFLILYRVYIMTESFHISLFEGTLHVDKIQDEVWFKIANITRALPIPVYRQTDFTPKRVVVLRLHDTAVRFCTRVKFLPRYKNRGDSRLHDILWWYHVNKYRAMRGNRSELAPRQKLPQCHVNTPSVVRGHRLLLPINNIFSCTYGQITKISTILLDTGFPTCLFSQTKTKNLKKMIRHFPQGV